VDAVRYVGNRSSGRMGYALASAAWRRGADVIVVSGPTTIEAPFGVEVVRVESAVEMHHVVAERVPQATLTIFAAAVADYRPAESRSGKVKRSEAGAEWSVDLVTNPDIALETRPLRKAGSVAVGFALETSDLLANAKKKLEGKGFDLLVANDATAEGSGFEVATNQVTLLWRDGRHEALPLLSKDEVAEEILDRVAPLLPPRTSA
jgi:phosphopantothenoylcysteine decarboxylase/phosphopantothenate--cysteine ligase